MSACMAIPDGLWAFLGVMAVLSGLALAGIAVVAVAERRGAHKQRQLRKVQVRGAVRIGPRLFPGAPAANDPHHRS